MADRVRVAVAGCGRMGRAHVAALESLDDPGIEVLCCDPREEARAWASARGIPAFEAVEEAHADAALDAVIVAATTSAHVALSAAALRLGCAVLCEKPGGTSPAELRELGAQADAAGLPLRLGYWHRFVPALRRAREAARSGYVGAVLALTGAQWDGTPPAAGFLAASGGEFVDMCVHEIDWATWVLGGRLEARGAAWREDPEGRNAAVGVLQSEHGTVVTVSAGRVLEGGRDGCWVEVLGTRASLFERWLWGPGGEELNCRAVADQDREFLALARGLGSGWLATAAEAAEVLHLANQLTAAALDACRADPRLVKPKDRGEGRET